MCGETTTIVLVKPLYDPSCAIDPPVLDFGEVYIYSPDPTTLSATIFNDGTIDFALTVDEDCPDFSVEASCGYIPPGGSCYLTVTFDPLELGPQECLISINGGLCELVCTAVVVDSPLCVIDPPGWDFGTVFAGEPDSSPESEGASRLGIEKSSPRAGV